MSSTMTTLFILSCMPCKNYAKEIGDLTLSHQAGLFRNKMTVMKTGSDSAQTNQELPRQKILNKMPSF